MYAVSSPEVKSTNHDQGNLRYFDAILQKIKKIENVNLVSQFFLWAAVQ